MSNNIRQLNLAFEYKPSKKGMYISVTLGVILLLVLMVTPLILLKHKLTFLKNINVQISQELEQKTVAMPELDITAINNKLELLTKEKISLAAESFKLDTSMLNTIENILPREVWISSFDLSQEVFNVKGAGNTSKEIEQFYIKLNALNGPLNLNITKTKEHYDFEIKKIK